MSQAGRSPNTVPGILKWKIVLIAVSAGGLAILGFFVAVRDLEISAATGWLALTTVALLLLFGALWRKLPANRTAPDGPVLRALGYGSLLTIFRGILLAYLFGFMAIPELSGWLAWVPGILFGITVFADFFDGFLARRQGLLTGLGEWLDVNIDAAGILIGCLVGIHFGRLPVWYLPVGLARYLFIFGIWVRERRGLAVFQLSESSRRRGLAGSQMIFITILLLPVFSPPATFYAAAVFMAVFLGSFLFDWFLVSGWIDPARPRWLGPNQSNLETRLPIILRLITAGLLIYVTLNSYWREPSNLPPTVILVLNFILAFMLIAGLAGRLAAVVILLMIGIMQMSGPLDLAAILLIIFASLVFFTGTGAWSIWSADGGLAGYRAGTLPGGSSKS